MCGITDFLLREQRADSVGAICTGFGISARMTKALIDGDCALGMQNPIRSQVETRFIGRIAEEETPFFANRKSTIAKFGFVPQAEALRLMEESDFLLVTMLDPTATSGKSYEYLPTGKPIIAIAVEGELSELIRETGAGWHIDSGNPEALITRLEQLFDPSRRLLNHFCPNWEAIRSYERPRLAGVFARIISESSVVEPSRCHSPSGVSTL